MSIKTILKKIVNSVLSDYEIYKIYQWNTSNIPSEVGTTDFSWAELRADLTLAAMTPALQPEIPPAVQKNAAVAAEALHQESSSNDSLCRESPRHEALRQEALVLKNQAYFAKNMPKTTALNSALNSTKNAAENAADNTADNAEDGVRVFVCLQQDTVVGICIYWYGERYLKRNFIRLQAQQAKLVHIETLPTMRGKGIASQLIRYSAAMMATSGFTRLYARIWHSNTPSIKSFTNAGWQYLTTIVTARSPLWGAFKVQFKPFNITRL
jgi:GNAT superfamily N-acetyltransferase